MFKFARILALTGLAFSTAACVTTDKATQNAITEVPTFQTAEIKATTIPPGEISEATFTAATGPAYEITAIEVIAASLV